MKNFLELLQIASTQGVVGVAAEFEGLPVSKTNVKSEFYSTSKKDLSLMENCRPFVFSDEDPIDDTLEMGNASAAKFGYLETQLDAPFSVFSIEQVNKPISTYLDVDNKRMLVYAILVIEDHPKMYRYFDLIGCGDPHPHHCRDKLMVVASNSDEHLVKHFLGRLKKEKTGVEKTRQRVRIGKGSEKRVATFRSIIHVMPKKDSIAQSSQAGNRIEFSHRFEVRGHWRKISGLGKNRDGQYCVTNFTWVKDHEKGPDGVPLIKKVRVVE